MSEETPETCPRCKCVAEVTTSVGTAFVCGSIAFTDDGIVQSRKCTASQRDQLVDEVKRLREWINDLDEIAHYKGNDGHREWHGDIGWLHEGQVVYLGEEKP